MWVRRVRGLVGILGGFLIGIRAIPSSVVAQTPGSLSASRTLSSSDSPSPGGGLTAAETGVSGVAGPDAVAGGVVPSDEMNPSGERLTGKDKKTLIWHDSIFIFDQSVSTETVGVGGSYQSRIPSYGWWLSFRPRVNLYEDKEQSFNLNARFDFYKTFTQSGGLTNGEDTTRYRENVFGDIWVNGVYARKVYNQRGWATTLGGGPRILLPTSTVSQAARAVVTAGVGVFGSQAVPLHRKSALFRNASFALSAYYTHPFVRNTTAENVDLNLPRMGIDGRTLQDTQLDGQFLVNHQLLTVAEGVIKVTPKLGLTLDFIMIDQWRYTPSRDGGQKGCSGAIPIVIQTGIACAGPSAQNQNPQNFTVAPWVLASFDYQVMDALNVALGYYNFANQIGPDGRRRNPFWAPESARLFLTATVGLDSLYQLVHEGDAGKAAKAQNRLAQSSSSSYEFLMWAGTTCGGALQGLSPAGPEPMAAVCFHRSRWSLTLGRCGEQDVAAPEG